VAFAQETFDTLAGAREHKLRLGLKLRQDVAHGAYPDLAVLHANHHRPAVLEPDHPTQLRRQPHFACT
jgi:hypothetical protein